MRTRDMLILSAGLVLSAFVFGTFFYQSRQATRTISVVGNASRRFETDTVKWRLRISVSADAAHLSGGYTHLREGMDEVVARIVAAGISNDDIALQPMNSNPIYSNQGTIGQYNLTQSLYVISMDIGTIEKLALKPDELISSGVIIEQSSLEYFYTKVDELKRTLIGDAALDARMRAQEIADSSGGTIGPIITARSGIFQITEPYSTEVSGYGVYNTSSRDKDIRITVHATFEMK